MGRTSIAVGCCALMAALAGAINGWAAGYVQTNLVSSNTVSIPAANQDLDLINPWGLTTLPTSPMWVSDNGRGVSTLYNGAGVKQGLVVTIPPQSGGASPSKPTGVVANPIGGDFAGSHFIFASENGTISTWTSGTSAIRVADNSALGAIYTGLAYQNTGSPGNHIFAANFKSGKVDVFDASFSQIFGGAFTDPGLPAGFAPYNIQNLGNTIYVTYAMPSGDPNNEDVPGLGFGFVSKFDTNGNFLQRLVSNGALNSPWGVALAPGDFGEFSNDLLVANHGDGLIHAYDPTTGALLGTLQDASTNPIVINGLRGLLFGNGTATAPTNTLYFTADPLGNTTGLLGSLAAPAAVPLPPAAWGGFALLGVLAGTKLWQRRRF